jgi:hypothetical protein
VDLVVLRANIRQMQPARMMLHNEVLRGLALRPKEGSEHHDHQAPGSAPKAVKQRHGRRNGNDDASIAQRRRQRGEVDHPGEQVDKEAVQNRPGG